MHQSIEPAIHYWGTPVVLVSSLNPDGSTNIAPMSSAWWLGWSCMLGLDASSCTTQNLRRHPECVLNLVDAGLVAAVDRLALTSGSETLPVHKQLLGYRSVADKFAQAGLTPLSSETVRPQRVAECRVQLEAVVAQLHAFAREDRRLPVPACAVEVRVVRTHVVPSLLADGGADRIDPDAWNPLLMSFRQFYARGERLQPSRLARAPEEAYAPWKRTASAVE